MANALNWFEIPAIDIQRATEFYQEILGVEMSVDEITPGFYMAMFPAEGGTGGAVMKGEGYTPSKEGSLIYLNAGEDLSGPLSKVEAAGGKVIQPKSSIGENEFYAFIEDTEGNRVGLHSMN